MSTISDAAKVAAALFVSASWTLFFSPDHKLLQEWSSLTVGARFATLSMEQWLAGLTASLSVIVLVSFLGLMFLESESVVAIADKHVATAKFKGSAGPSGLVKSMCCAVAAACVIFSVKQASVRFMVQWHEDEWPDSFGLLCGIGSVAIAQVCLMAYHFICQRVYVKRNLIQPRGPTVEATNFVDAALVHFSNSSAFLLLLLYLSLTWMFRLMPSSYYEYDTPVQWNNVLLQLLLVDLFTFTNHVAEHSIPELYKRSHKPHHQFYSPQLFNAFDGSLADTVGVILFPLFTTAQLLHVSNWDYIAFGTIYSTHFMLIHSEFQHFFDPLIGFFFVNIAEDHHVHHAMQTYNYSHFFTIYDKLAGTYRAGNTCPGFASNIREKAQ